MNFLKNLKKTNLNNTNYTKLAGCLLLVIITMLVYWTLQNHEFIHMDDNAYVFSNIHVQSGLIFENIKWAFTSTDASFWHPLTWLSLMLDYELFKLNAGGYHWTNLLLHIISTVLLFLVLNKMTGSVWRSGFVAALFALHPLHVESVAWIAQRKDVLSGVFWMLTMHVYLAYTSRPNFRRYFLILLVFVLGLMAKPMLVTLPFVLLLLDYWPLNRFTFELKQEGENKRRKLNIVPIGEGNTISRLILEKVPLIVLSIIFSVIVFITEQKDSALASLDSLSLFARISNALVSYVEYISKMIIPVNLAVFYPHPGTWPLWQVLLCLAVLISITYIVIFYIKKYPYLAVGWFWYLGTFVPVIGLVQVGSHAMADRYTYIPLIGLFVIIAWGLFDLTKECKYGKTIFSSIGVFIIATMMVMTSIQVSYWKNSISLFSHAIEVTNGNYMAHCSIGAAFLSKNKTDEAIEHYSAAVKFRNDYALAYYGLGFAHEIKKNYDKSLFAYVSALNISPNYFEVHYQMANLRIKMDRIDEAIFFCRKAIALRPDTAEPHNTLGNLYTREGKDDAAIGEFKIALKLAPEHAGIHNNLAMVYMHQERINEAIIHFQEAIRLQPEYANAHFYLAKVLKRKRLYVTSRYHYREAIRINPEYKDKSW